MITWADKIIEAQPTSPLILFQFLRHNDINIAIYGNYNGHNVIN
jgi:hypothetical protein